MKIITSPSQIRHSISPLKNKSRIALVPTMGNLHQGHLALVKKAKELADKVIVSIFVNPLQFAPNEDYASYPRTMAADVAKLESLDVDVLFTPTREEMISDISSHATVSVPGISSQYCGAFRPNFFTGVTTVVTKLFNIITPDIAIFGEKDFQQLHIIKKMVSDLCFPVHVVPYPTIREANGLAMSSRNHYLSDAEKLKASEIYKTLCEIRAAVLSGINIENILDDARDRLLTQAFIVDYISVCNKHTLEPLADQDREIVVLIAARLGKTRLIDNLIFSR